MERPFGKVESLLQIGSSDDICVIGIWGRGGIGKTTLARFMFKKLSTYFEGRCFLQNVREEWEKHGGEIYQRNTLFSSVLGKNYTYSSDFGIPTAVRDMLGRTKSLVVLDDVNEKEQLESLVGYCNWLGTGSRIIVTTRDLQCLPSNLINDSDVYEVKGLNPDEARQLFCLNTSNKSLTYPPGLLDKVLAYAEGIPLVLKVLRWSFIPGRDNWESLLDKLKSCRGGENIRNALMISYNDLSKRQKDVFLDIACFFKGWNRNEVEIILEVQGFSADSAIKDLVDKSLITIGYFSELCMHDLVQEMGWEIVRKQSSKLGERSRLSNAQEIYHVLKNNGVSELIEGILLDVSKIKEVHLSPCVFKQAFNLRMLKFYNYSSENKTNVHLPEGLSSFPDSLTYLDWPHYPSKSFPSGFAPEKLVHLKMRNSKVEKLWDGDQNLRSLKSIDLSFSKNLTEIPHLSQAPNLEVIRLEGCSSLSTIPSHKFRNLGRLRYLSMFLCERLQTLPIAIESAEYLSVGGCINLRNIPEIKNANLSILHLSRSTIKELPESIGFSKNLSKLDLRNSKSLKKLPSNIYRLKLKILNLWGCSSLEKIPERLPTALTELCLDDTAIGEILPSSIKCLSRLKELSLKNCKRLQNLPNNICKLQSVEELDLYGCSKFEKFPEILERMERLRNLNLSGTSIRTLPSSIEKLVALKTLDLTACEKLEYVYSDNWLHSMKSINLNYEIYKNISELYLCNCKSLKNLPSNIYPLKLKILNLSGCSSLEKIPELLLTALTDLCLDDTAIGEILPSSIEGLSRLKFLSLRNCQRLQNLPNSICKLQSLKQLDLSGCSKFDDFPEIMEPMKSLQYLNLSETSIKTLPSAIKHLVALHTLDLTSCEKLEFKCGDNLLHWMAKCSNLKVLYVEGCTSLVSVTSSRDIIREGFHDKHLFQRDLFISFFNCLNLDQNSRQNIMTDCQLQIARTAIQAISPRFQRIDSGSTSICYPGSEIPEWFDCQETGSSIIMKVPPSRVTSDFLGFSLCFVAAFEDSNVNLAELRFQVNYSWTTKFGEEKKFKKGISWETKPDYGRWEEKFTNSDHVFMNGFYEIDLDGFTHVEFHLVPDLGYPAELGYPAKPVNSCKVKRCGLRLLSLEDVEKDLGISIPINFWEEDEEISVEYLSDYQHKDERDSEEEDEEIHEDEQEEESDSEVEEDLTTEEDDEYTEESDSEVEEDLTTEEDDEYTEEGDSEVEYEDKGEGRWRKRKRVE